jgi:anaerobic magnesium-protoporphyrin IX monomethyl ester cyclase
MTEAKIILVDTLGYANNLSRHTHFVKDWTGARLPADVCLPPLDFMYAAAYLRQYGCQVKIIEANIKHYPPAKVVDIIRNNLPHFVVIPYTIMGIEADKYLSVLIRKSLPATKIIFFGPLVTYDPAVVLLDNSADYVALGELELPLLNIIKGDYAENVAYKDEQGRVIIGKRRLLDLKELPIPARDIIDNQAYRYAVFNKRNPLTAMTISRGCPYSKCEFCHSNLYTLGQIRYRDFTSIIEEIKEIVFKYKISEIFFRDQAITANRDLISNICEYLIAHKIEILWRGETRVDLVDRDLLNLMHHAGCYQMSFGFESSSQKVLDKNNKGITPEQSRQAARLAKEAGIEVVGLFLYGMLGDTKESMEKQLSFALDLRVDYANFEAICFMPGAPGYENVIKTRPEIFPQEVLRGYVKKAYARFYLRPSFIFKYVLRLFHAHSWSYFFLSIKLLLEAFLFFWRWDFPLFGVATQRSNKPKGF